jgi:hypothetical protein
MPEPLGRSAFLTQLRQSEHVVFPPYAELWAPAPDIVADNVGLLMSPGESVRYALQLGEFTESPRRKNEWLGDVTWYLATDEAMLRLEISVTPSNQWTHTVVRCRRWQLATIRWIELEDTHPGAPGDRSCRLTVSFGEEEGLILESRPEHDAPLSNWEAIRQFAAVLMGYGRRRRMRPAEWPRE